MRAARVSSPAIVLYAALLSGCGGGSPAPAPSPTPPSGPPPAPTIPTGLSATLTSMLQDLTGQIAYALQTNQENLPRNPQNATYIQAKIAMLQQPSLAAEIINGARWAEVSPASISGRAVPIVVVFPLESMRSEATLAVRTLEPVLSILEGFFAMPFPTTVIRVWYGFAVGSAGGGGVMYAEDRTTYEARTGANRLPYDAVFGHELGHSYISNESLNQFLELYTYNLVRGASTDPRAWTFTRNWVADNTTNQDVAAVLDVYLAIGHDTMMRAYRAIYPLYPPYGQPLSQAVIDAFIAEVPPASRPQVSAKLARVMF